MRHVLLGCVKDQHFHRLGSLLANVVQEAFYFIYFILFATLITKNIGKEEEKKKRSGEET